MSVQIILVLFALCFALVFFINGKLRVDTTALIVLCFLAVTGLVNPHEAVAAFGNPAVVTIWAMYILSAALVKTNIATMIGNNVLKFSGKGETGLIIVIMIVSGFLSAFMNNIGVAALMLPVVMSISKMTNHSPSRLLLPMAFGVLLGGTTTLLTTMNILVSNTLLENNYTPFGLFDFTPVGIFILSGGIIFTAFIGRKLLPQRDLVKESIGTEKNLEDQYELQERMNSLRVPSDSPLVMKSIAEINVGTVTGLTVVAILRNGKTILAPDPSIRINRNDIIIIEGRLDRLNEFRGWHKLQIEDHIPEVTKEIADHIQYAEVTVSENSELAGKTYYEIHFRKKFRINVFAIKKGTHFLQGNLASQTINSGDILLIRSKPDIINELSKSTDFRDLTLINKNDLETKYDVQESLFTVMISEDSDLNEKTLSKSRMGAVFGLHVLAIKRNDELHVMPMPDDIVHKHDKLVIACRQEDLDLLRGLQDLQLEKESALKIEGLESDQIGLVEVSIAPRSGVVGKTLRDIHFRTKYGMQVIAIWHEGRAIRTNLRDIELNFGDALLLMGKRENINLLKADPDFIVLSQDVDQVLNKKKAPVSGIIMLLFVLTIVFGWLPISIAALSAVVLMIVTGCLKIEDAYKAIDWRSIFLIAGMMPLGIAIQKTGTAQLVSNLILSLHNSVGDWGIMILLYSLITAASVVIPTSALVVFMAPIFISISQQLDVSPYAVMMVLAVSASASFISPVSHPANVLVMGPGGYRFSDYTKVGLPLTIVVMIIGLIMISVFWPL